MKLTSVEIHSPNSPNVIVLSFRDPTRALPYNIKDITGLDAEEIISKYSGMAANSTTRFNALFISKRQVIIKISMNPAFDQNQSYSDLRDSVYRMISSAKTGRVQLYFKNLDTTIATLSGYISKFETQQADPVPEIQLTIFCDEPFMIAPTPINMPVAGLNLANFVIQDDNSTAPHGFKMTWHFTANVNGFITIKDPNDPSWFFKITPPLVWLSGDRADFSSEYNNRYLTVTRSGGTVNHMSDSIAAGSVWPEIFPGKNTFSFDVTTNLVLDSISYSYAYWGV